MDTQKINEQLNYRRDFVTNSNNNMSADPDSETSNISTNSTELRKIHDPNSEKCAILEMNIKDLKLQHQLEIKEKDEIISKLKLELERANNIIEQSENGNSERVSTANLASTENESRQKRLDDIHSLEIKFQSKLKRLQLDFERQQLESGKLLMKLNCDVMAIQEKMNETNNLMQCTAKLNDLKLYKQTLPREETIPPVDRYMDYIDPVTVGNEWNKTAEPGFMNDSMPFYQEMPQTEFMSSLMMVDGLDQNTANTDKLFNLLCLYGNVVWIHILEREEAAIVQMADWTAVERCLHYLNNIPVGSTGLLKIVKYDTFFISKEASQTISDGSLRYKDYTAYPSRFDAEHRVLQPIKNTFFYYAPTITETNLKILLTSQQLLAVYIKINDGKPCGLIKFENTAEAVWAIMKCNNMLIGYEGYQFPFIMNFSQY